MEKLYRFKWDMRGGPLEGLFVENEEEVKEIIGKEVYFGEVLGKHSEVFGVIEEGEIEVLSDDPTIVAAMKEIQGRWDSICGVNPITFFREQEAGE